MKSCEIFFFFFQYHSRRYFIGAADAASYRVSIREHRHCYAAAATRCGYGHRHERYVHGSSYRGEGGSRGGNVQRVRADSGLHRHAKQGVLILEPAPRVPHVGRKPLRIRLSFPRYHLVHKHIIVSNPSIVDSSISHIFASSVDFCLPLIMYIIYFMLRCLFRIMYSLCNKLFRYIVFILFTLPYFFFFFHAHVTRVIFHTKCKNACLLPLILSPFPLSSLSGDLIMREGIARL